MMVVLSTKRGEETTVMFLGWTWCRIKNGRDHVSAAFVEGLVRGLVNGILG